MPRWRRTLGTYYLGPARRALGCPLPAERELQSPLLASTLAQIEAIVGDIIPAIFGSRSNDQPEGKLRRRIGGFIRPYCSKALQGRGYSEVNCAIGVGVVKSVDCRK